MKQQTLREACCGRKIDAPGDKANIHTRFATTPRNFLKSLSSHVGAIFHFCFLLCYALFFYFIHFPSSFFALLPTTSSC